MAHSPLATESYPAYGGNYTKGRNTTIKKICIHHMAGKLTAGQCGAIFQRVGRNGSSHYGIGYDGKIGWYVDESDTAWTNSNWPSNCESVNIETSNDGGAPDWHVSDASLLSLKKLVKDIKERNNLGTLKVGENLAYHSMLASTTCPGPYLRSKLQEIADYANTGTPAPTPTPAPAPTPTPSTNGIKVGDKVVPKKWVDVNGTQLIKTRDYYYVSSIAGNRAVLRADSVSGVTYAAVDANNLTKVGGGSAPAPAPSTGIKVGDKVTLINWVDYNGTRLAKTRNFYYVKQISGDRVVLAADSVNGPVYAAVKKSNLKGI